MKEIKGDLLIGDDYEHIRFSDRTENQHIGLNALVDPDEGFAKFYLTKKDAVELRDWLNKLIEKENW